MTERREGHSRLVYNKTTRTIDAVDPHPSDAVAVAPALHGLVGLIDLVLVRDDLTPDLRDALTTNHRIVTARAAIRGPISPVTSNHVAADPETHDEDGCANGTPLPGWRR